MSQHVISKSKYLTGYYLGPDQVMPSDANIVQEHTKRKDLHPFCVLARERSVEASEVCAHCS